jgi:hypothetical protein
MGKENKEAHLEELDYSLPLTTSAPRLYIFRSSLFVKKEKGEIVE